MGTGSDYIQQKDNYCGDKRATKQQRKVLRRVTQSNGQGPRRKTLLIILHAQHDERESMACESWVRMRDQDEHSARKKKGYR